MSVMPPSPLSYTGEVATPYILKTFPPASSNNKFSVPTIWVDTDASDIYILARNEYIAGVRTAEWVKIGNDTGTVEGFNVDASTAPGTDPVLPIDSGGIQLITITGGQVAAGTTANVIQTNSLAANTFTVQVQRASSQASSTVGANGVSHFNSVDMSVDSNGFVTWTNPHASATPFVFGSGTISSVDPANRIPLGVAQSVSGGAAYFEVKNNSNTASSGAALVLTTGGTSGGNPYVTFQGTTTPWNITVDQASSATFKIGTGNTLSGGTTLFQATNAGVVSVPNANGTAGFVVGSTTLGTNDSMTIGGNGNGSELQLSMRPSSAARPIFSVLSNDAAVSPSIEMGVNGATQWSFGVLASASNAFTMYSGSDIGSGTLVMSMTTAGLTTFPVNTLGIAIGTGGPTITSGSGAPASSQPKGSLYLRTDGSGTNDRMYVATDSAGTWTAVVTVA